MPIIEVDDPTMIIINHPTDKASVKVSLKGATIISWKMFNNELLYLSPMADTDINHPNIPIRGGIPLCWPIFGAAPKDSSLPKHGFARQCVWTYLGSEVDENEDISGTFELTHNEETLKMYPYQFKLQLKILLGMSYLQTSIHIINEIENKDDMNCQFLFHNYLHTDNLATSVVTGLKNFSYTDQVLKIESTDRSAILPIVGEVDRIYRRHIHDGLRYRDEELLALGDGGNCDITLRAINLYDAVIWNPSEAKPLPDLPPDGYKDFVCVELGTVSEKIKIKPGESFVGSQRLVLRILSKMSEYIRRQHAEQANDLIKKDNLEKQIAKILPPKSQELTQQQQQQQQDTLKQEEDDQKEAEQQQ